MRILHLRHRFAAAITAEYSQQHGRIRSVSVGRLHRGIQRHPCAPSCHQCRFQPTRSPRTGTDRRLCRRGIHRRRAASCRTITGHLIPRGMWRLGLTKCQTCSYRFLREWGPGLWRSHLRGGRPREAYRITWHMAYCYSCMCQSMTDLDSIKGWQSDYL
jgi:hypothetical protein